MANDKVRERILRATQELLDEKDIADITSRDIAGRAGVGLGSIIYHFNSRDEALYQAVAARFRSAAEDCRGAETENAPRAALAQQMEGMLRILLRFGDTARFVLRHKMTCRHFTAERHMASYIRRFYDGRNIDPLDVKLKAMQLTAAVSTAFFNREEFFRYTDLNLDEAQDVSRFVQALLDSVLGKPEGAEYEKGNG